MLSVTGRYSSSWPCAKENDEAKARNIITEGIKKNVKVILENNSDDEMLSEEIRQSIGTSQFFSPRIVSDSELVVDKNGCVKNKDKPEKTIIEEIKKKAY